MAEDDGVTIHAGRDITGPVVIGDDNDVTVEAEPLSPCTARADAGPAEIADGTRQEGRAATSGTVYQVQGGDMHLHHAPAPEPTSAAAAGVPAGESRLAVRTRARHAEVHAALDRGMALTEVIRALTPRPVS